MGRHSCLAKQKLRKGLWSPEEDVKLFNFISKNGVGCWSSIPKQAGLQRCGKSCRLRWLNYLRPDLKRGVFSQHEEEVVINLHKVLGNRWAQIAVHLPGRTDNEIKNFWNSCLKKKLMKQGIDPKTHKRLNNEGMDDPFCSARNSTADPTADSDLQQPEQSSNSAALLVLPMTAPTIKNNLHPTSYCYYNSSRSTDHAGLFQSGHAVFSRPVLFDTTTTALLLSSSSSSSSPPFDTQPGFGSLNRSPSGILSSNIHQQNFDHLSSQLEQVSNCGLNLPNLSTNAPSYNNLGDHTNFSDSTSTQGRGISSNSLMSLVHEAEESSTTCSQLANYNVDHTAVALSWEDKFKCLLEYSHDRGRRHDAGIKMEEDVDHKLSPWLQIVEEEEQIHFNDGDDHHPFRTSSCPIFKPSFSEDLARLDGDIFLHPI